MDKLESMQRYAERILTKADADRPVKVQWAGTTCKLRARYSAHVHASKRDPLYGTICIKRGLPDWRDTIRHEVAHLLPQGAGGHGAGFTRALARAGDPYAKAAMREYDIAVKGKRHHHDWIRGRVLKRNTTQHGLVFTYDARCRLCGKRIPKEE